MLEAIASTYRLGYAQTLTGFKWIARVPNLMFGYEEALGYCVDPDHVKDKDGITAALMIAEMTSRLKAKDRTLQDVLDDLALAFGVHATRQVSVRVDDLARIDDVMGRLRSHPPTSVAGREVKTIDDLNKGLDGLPPTDGLRIRLSSSASIIVRPSGTEPKVKCYLQSVVPVVDDDLPAARQAADDELDAIAADVTRWLE